MLNLNFNENFRLLKTIELVEKIVDREKNV